VGEFVGEDGGGGTAYVAGAYAADIADNWGILRCGIGGGRRFFFMVSVDDRAVG